MITVSEEVKALSYEIAVKSQEEAEYFPVDRNFLHPYLNRILSLNAVEFIFLQYRTRKSNLYKFAFFMPA